jgi:hypothetical protein
LERFDKSLVFGSSNALLQDCQYGGEVIGKEAIAR